MDCNRSLHRGLWIHGSVLLLAVFGSTKATEFGGVAEFPVTSNFNAKVLAAQWERTGALKWVRTSSDSKPAHGLGQLGIVHWTQGSPHSDWRELPEDLLALYWHCRTNYPVSSRADQAWEIWNEPDFHFVRGNPDQMASVLKAAYWGLKAANPRASVLMPSLAFTPDKYQRELFRNNAFRFTDGYNFHFYGWAQDFLTSICQHRSFLHDLGIDLPLWVTEAGYFDLSVSEAEDPIALARQQVFHERLAVTAQAAQIAVYSPFILTPYIEAGSDLSLVQSDLTPRPALESYLALTRLLPKTKAIWQLWHRPSAAEVGYVLEETQGTWLTVLWTPQRWRAIQLPGLVPPAALTGGESSGDPTGFELEIQFPPANRLVRLGLLAPADLKAPTELKLRASMTNNVFLRTSPFPFEIRDIDWRPVASSASKVIIRDRGFSAQLEHPEGNVKHAPSPVTLQITYDPTTALADKPSQAYRYRLGTAVRARVMLYNFSEHEQAGEWSLTIPGNWLATVLHRGHEVTPFSDALKLPPIGSDRSLTARMQLKPLSRSRVDVLFVPALAEQTVSDAALSRRIGVETAWVGDNGLSDGCFSWLEPTWPFHGPTWHVPVEQWFPDPKAPEQWEVNPVRAGEVHLVLQQEPPENRFASIFAVLPAHLALEENDMLCLEVRCATAHPAFLRINLLTLGKESFRFGEDEPIGANWMQFNGWLADLGPTLWSELSPEYRLIPKNIRFLRMSFENLQAGDFVEIRNVGVRKSTGR